MVYDHLEIETRWQRYWDEHGTFRATRRRRDATNERAPTIANYRQIPGHLGSSIGARQGFDLQLTQYDERGWRATFYTTGMEHSPTSATGTAWERTPWHATQRAAWEAVRQASGDGLLGRHANRRLRSPATLPAAPTLKHPEQEEDEGGIPVIFLDDAPLDFKARACTNRLVVRNGRRTGVRQADSGVHTSHAGGYEQHAHDGEDYNDAE